MNLLDKIYKLNSQWADPNSVTVPPFRRDLFSQVIGNLDTQLMKIIIGPRRTGKSILLKQVLQYLLQEQGILPDQTLYYECSPNEPTQTVDQIHDFILNKTVDKTKKVYVFLDEIQYIDKYEVPIKLIYDNFPNIKFFLTGSLSLTYKRKMSESLAGRFLPHYLYPLSFSEYLYLTNSPRLSNWDNLKSLEDQNLAKSHLLLLNPEFKKFLEYGRLPQLPQMDSPQAKKSYLESVISQSLSQDAFDYFEIREPQTLWAIFRYLQQNNGSLVKSENLSNLTQSTRQTITKYLDILEIMGLIYQLYNSQNPLHKLNSSRKIYLSSHYALLGTKYDQDTAMGFAVESYILERFLEQGKHPTFYRKRNIEIDLLIPDQKQAFEIKFSTNYGTLKSLTNFCQKNLYSPHLITLNQISKEGTIACRPACLV